MAFRIGKRISRSEYFGRWTRRGKNKGSRNSYQNRKKRRAALFAGANRIADASYQSTLGRLPVRWGVVHVRRWIFENDEGGAC
jgi:hypothetical protein